jgi:hypothetical protein
MKDCLMEEFYVDPNLVGLVIGKSGGVCYPFHPKISAAGID